ncbi:MAG: hypothetical protein HYV55_00810 [Parcubacteria group bacterium]|nr:hypothetical protein [Parcubacteria group bacterium]
MIAVLSYEPDQELFAHMEALAQTHHEEVKLFTSFKGAEEAVCRGRVQSRPDKPAGETVTQVIVHNRPAPAASREPTPMTAVRRFNDCWGTRGGERVLEAVLFPEPLFTRSNRDSERPRWRHTAILLT